MAQQIGQITGRLKKEEDYGCPEYFKLVQTVVPLRKSFRFESDREARKEIASEQYKAWMSFLEARKEMLKDHPEFKFDFSSQKMLKETFDRLTERQSAKLPSKSLIDLHGQFSQFYKLRVPIHPRNLA